MDRLPVRLEELGGEGDGRRRSPSAWRNQGEILAVLSRVLPERARVLELASGTGEHALCFAAAQPGWDWQPSERDEDGLASIQAWRAAAGLPNLREPVRLDLGEGEWPAGPFDAVVAINLLHIAPWSVARALLAGAGRAVREGGRLFLYGAYLRDGHETAPSNLDFDAELRSRNPEWGLRQLEGVAAAAATHGLELSEVAEMPNNNFGILFTRGG